VSEGILLCGESLECADMYYATRFLSGEPFVYLETAERSIAVVGESDLIRARAVSTVDEVWADSDFDWFGTAVRLGSPVEAFLHVALAALRRAGVSSLTVPGWFPSGSAAHLRAHEIEVTVDPDVIARRRRCKRPDEVDAISQTLRVAELSLAHARSMLGECDVAADGTLIRNGVPLTSESIQDEIRSVWALHRCEGRLPIVAGGRQAADGYERGHGPLYAGQPIVCDLSPRHTAGRYHADVTRVFCVGPADEHLHGTHAAVRAALEAAREACRPGVRGSDIYRLICDAFLSRGYPSTLHPRVDSRDRVAGSAPAPEGAPYAGHGLGLDLHEDSTGIDPYNHQILEPGDVLTLEPELYDIEWGAVRLEDVVVVAENGCRTLTDFDYDLGVQRGGDSRGRGGHDD
jgi:Xaa-Pro aminopeptidase